MDADWERFCPPNARAIVGVEGAPPLISGQLLSRHAQAIDAPVVEVSARRGAALVGFLRACRQLDALAVVTVDDVVRRRSPSAANNALLGVLAAGAQARADRPIVVVARAPVSMTSAPSADDVHAEYAQSDALARDVGAGYSSVSLDVDVAKDGELLGRLTRLALELDLGVELEVPAPVGNGVGADVALILAMVDDRGLPVSAVRGAGLHDEVGHAARVVDIAAASAITALDPGGLRVNIDSVVGALDGSDDDVEVKTWLLTTRLLRTLKAQGSAGRLRDALERAP